MASTVYVQQKYVRAHVFVQFESHFRMKVMQMNLI